MTDSAGNTATFAYNASNLVSGVTLSDGRSTGFGYTSGRLTSFTDVRGKQWTYSYDAGGRLTTITDPLSLAQVTNVYDPSSGRVTSQTDATGKTTQFAWDAGAQTATMTDNAGHVWKDVYVNGVLSERIDGTTNGTDGVYAGATTTSAVFATGSQWGVTVEHNPSGPVSWTRSRQRVANPRVSGGQFLFDIQTDDGGGSGLCGQLTTPCGRPGA